MIVDRDLEIGFEAEKLFAEHLRASGYEVKQAKQYDQHKDFRARRGDGPWRDIELKAEVLYASRRGFTIPNKPTQIAKYLNVEFFVVMQMPIVWEPWSVRRNRIEDDDMHAIRLWAAPSKAERRLEQRGNERPFFSRDPMDLISTIRDPAAVTKFRSMYISAFGLPSGAIRG